MVIGARYLLPKQGVTACLLLVEARGEEGDERARGYRASCELAQGREGVIVCHSLLFGVDFNDRKLAWAEIVRYSAITYHYPG